MGGLDQLRGLVKEAKAIAFFGGAGCSTESGIPDFRSEAGRYQAKSQYGYAPETMLSHHFFESQPREFYHYYLQEFLYPQAKPNDAHQALVTLEHLGKLCAIVTQNCDGLHQEAGSKRVLELHGSVRRNHCLNCGAHYGLDFMLSFRNQEALPCCYDCGSLVRPDVVLYEEELDAAVYKAAAQVIRQADLLIVGGTSLSVYPAAGLLHEFRGNRLALINKSATDLDEKADLLLHESIGKALKYAVEAY